MKNRTKLYLIILLVTLLPITIFATGTPETSEQETVGKGNLIINIEGFKSDEGNAMIALVNSETNYEESNNYREKRMPVADKKVQCILEDLKFGEYAVKVFHDENSNGELDTAMFGIPKEAYGFSNDARGKLGAPAYSKVVFQFNSSEQEIFIKVK